MSRNGRSLSALAAAVSLLFAQAACSFLTKTDRDKIDETGGAAGSAGSDTGGSGGATTTSATSGSGGATCSAECCSTADCPDSGNECVQRTCEKGVCGTALVGEGVAVSTQSQGDCQRLVCDGEGGVKTVIADDDLPDDGNPCTLDKCQGGEPKNTNTPAGQACSVGEGVKCDGSGACVECVSPSDCASKVCTINGECAPAKCVDGVKNADETDVDCGGVCGATCATGEGCVDQGDCLNHVCDAMTGKCAAPKCTDKVENGDETDVDCGGSCGSTCAPGKGCDVDLDCKGKTCSGSFCLPSCIDGVLNNGEKAIDCGGPVCTSTCPVATPCDVPSDCASGFCVDAVCCATACTADCSACTAALKGSGEDGQCGVVPPGTDPHADCGVTDPGTCGDATGLCAANGKCEKWPAMTPCGDPLSCTNGIQINADGCDGAGMCADAGQKSCGLYACGAAACNTVCADEADCASTAYCLAGACTTKKPVASTCSSGVECVSGHCADGRCCDQACNGVCQACSVAAGVAQNGVCSPIPNLQDPANECAGASLCDGAGACKKDIGQSCLFASECLSGFCADGFCCQTQCVGLCQACSNLKKGAGADGSCGFVITGIDPEDECPGDTVCQAGNCNYFAQGTACSVNGECASGFCVDGFCCNAACQGFCQACSLAKTGVANGVCDDITTGTDPDGECPGADVCNGNFGCQP